MASIVVAGDTSGTVTLAAPAVSGTTTLTLPTTSGTIITTGGGAAGSFTTLTSSADASFATSSGNVGIGTNSPTTKLEVAGFAKGAIVHRAGTYTAGATTPSVSGVTFLSIANSSPTTITNFTNAEAGQIIYLYFDDSNTTINRSNAYLAGGANFVSTVNDMLVLIKIGPYWYEISRSANA
jgi:hypothetical protein